MLNLSHRVQGMTPPPPNPVRMRTLGELLMRRGLGRTAEAAPCCAACRRRLLPGELSHVYDGGRVACTLCAKGEPLRKERVHAALRPLAVERRAA